MELIDRLRAERNCKIKITRNEYESIPYRDNAFKDVSNLNDVPVTRMLVNQDEMLKGSDIGFVMWLVKVDTEKEMTEWKIESVDIID